MSFGYFVFHFAKLWQALLQELYFLRRIFPHLYFHWFLGWSILTFTDVTPSIPVLCRGSWKAAHFPFDCHLDSSFLSQSAEHHGISERFVLALWWLPFGNFCKVTRTHLGLPDCQSISSRGHKIHTSLITVFSELSKLLSKMFQNACSGIIELAGFYRFPLLEIIKICLFQNFIPIIGAEVGIHRST